MDSIFSSWQQSWSWEMGWHIVGWTMLYFLAAGTVMQAMLWFMRLILRNAQPKIRYAATLAGFAVLALMPIGITGWLAAQQASPERQRREFTTNLTNGTNKNLNAEFAKSAEVAEKNLLVAEVTENRVPDQTISVTQAASVSLESVLNGSVEYLPWVWLIGTPLTFLLLTTGLVGADRLRRSCRVLTEGPIHATCEQLRTALGIGREVGIAICDRVTTPLLVGVVRPLILLPPAALLGWPPEQLEMVLLHELAHVRRWDNAVNLVQRIVESVLFFHPAVWIVSNWVRRDREDCCDAVVVAHTAKPQAYAELLVALAANQPLASLAASAFARHPLASRIRRILKLEDEPMLVSRKGLTLYASAIVAVVLCAVFLTRSEAEETQASRKRERPEFTTNGANSTNQDLTTEDTEGTEENRDPKKKEVRRVYQLEGSETDIKNWLNAMNDIVETQVISKDGKESVVVSATDEGHEKLVKMLEARRAATSDTPFPSLEEQKAADFAYKLIEVELEKLRPEDLERVKAKGYAGGMLVASDGAGELLRGDLLVGLHIWPTESLEQVQEILTRFDIHDLTPLKFYVIRRQLDPKYGGPTPEDVDNAEDVLIKGRIAVNLTAWAEKEGFKQARLPGNEDIPAGISGQSESAILLKMAEKNHELAVQKYEQSLEANQKVKGSVREIELHGLKTAADLAQLEVERQRLQLEPVATDNKTSSEEKFDGNDALELQKLVALKRQMQEQLAEKEKKRKEAIGSEAALLDAEIEQLQEIVNRVSHKVAQEKENIATGITPLYDGKPFEEWKTRLQTEIKFQNRNECAVAIVAFGRTNHGKEAARLLLNLIEESTWKPSMIEGNNLSALESICLDAFARHLPDQVAVSAILEAADDENPRIREFAELVAPLRVENSTDRETVEKELRKRFPDMQVPEQTGGGDGMGGDDGMGGGDASGGGMF